MLREDHRNSLITEHAITEEVIVSSGVRSGSKGMIFKWTDGTRAVDQARIDDQHRKPGAPRYLWPEDEPLVINHFREPQNGEPIILAEGTMQHLAVASWTDQKIGVFGIVGCRGWSKCDLSWAEDRDVIVLFDADMSSNRDVHDAARGLMAALELEGARTVKFVPPPGSTKEGIDDVLARRPEDTRARYLVRLLAKASEKIGRSPAKRKDKDDPESIAKIVMDKYPVAITREDKVSIYTDGVFKRNPQAFNSIMVDILGPEYWPSLVDATEKYIAGKLYGERRMLPDRVADPILNVRNGMLDLRTGELVDHDPKYLSSTQIPVIWDTSASAPTYVEWLDQVIRDQADDLEETVSMMLDPSRTPPKAAFLFGPSRSGKSTMLRILERIAGDDNASAVSLAQLVEDKFKAINVYGKILNAAAEVRAGHIDDLDIFKKMTGDDPIDAERKFVQGIKFYNKALFIFAANELPTVGESSRAYSERIKPFKFGNSFAGREDPKIEEKIIGEELPGVLVRLVDAWRRRDARGNYLPTSPGVAIEFENKSDRVRMFVSSCCRIVSATEGALLPPGDVTTKRDIVRAFDRWSEINKGAKLGSLKITTRLTSINGVKEVRRSDTKARGLNIVIKPETEWDDQEEVAKVAVSNLLSPLSMNHKVGADQEEEEEESKRSGGEKEKTATVATNATVPQTEDGPMNMVTLDLETAGVTQAIFSYGEGFLRLGAYANGSGPVIAKDMDEIMEVVRNPQYVITGHNLTGFDLIALAKYKGLDLRTMIGRTADTDLLVRLDDPPESGKDGISIRPKGYYGLDQSAARYGVAGKTDDLARLAARYGGYDKIPLDDPEYRSYLEGDISASTGLIGALPPMNDYAKREQTIGLMTGQMTLNGFRVDVPELTRTLAEQGERKIANFSRLSLLTGLPLNKVTKYKTKADKVEPYANPLATKEGKEAVVNALIDAGIPEEAFPRTGKTRVVSLTGDLKTVINEYHARKPFKLKDKTRAQEVLNLVTDLVGERTVYQTAETYRVGDRVHPEIRPYQASGRWSVTKPGLTVYGKRNGKHVERRIYLPEPGERILTVDLDQVDMRSVAAHSGDEGYLEIFRSGRDPHAEIALAVFGDVKFREIAKPIGHGWNYGESVRMITSQGVPLELAQQFDDQMRSKYPRLVEWQREVRAVAGDGDLLDNGFGRKMRAHPQFAYTQAPALVGQGCTRDILAEGLLRLPLEIWPMLRVIVHDEIVLSVPEKDFEEIKNVVLAAFTFDLADVTNGVLASVPITAGASKPGTTWAEVYEK